MKRQYGSKAFGNNRRDMNVVFKIQEIVLYKPGWSYDQRKTYPVPNGKE